MQATPWHTAAGVPSTVSVWLPEPQQQAEPHDGITGA